MADEADEPKAQQTSQLSKLLSPDFTVSKRQLGVALVLLGVLGFLGILALDLIGGGREGGIGPAQRAALVLMVGIAIFGATLIPLGDRPA